MKFVEYDSKSGNKTTFAKLTLGISRDGGRDGKDGEVALIARTVIAMIRHAQANAKGIACIASLCNVLDQLTRKVDWPRYGEFVRLAKEIGYSLPEKLRNPGRSYALYKGLNQAQRHVLRRYKHADIVRKVGAEMGFDFDKERTEVGFFSDLREIPQEPTPEIAALLAINRQAESKSKTEHRGRRRTALNEARAEQEAAHGPNPSAIAIRAENAEYRTRLKMEQGRNRASEAKLTSNYEAEIARLTTEVAQMKLDLKNKIEGIEEDHLQADREIAELGKQLNATTDEARLYRERCIELGADPNDLLGTEAKRAAAEKAQAAREAQQNRERQAARAKFFKRWNLTPA